MLPHDDVGSGPAIVLLHAGIADRTMWAEHLDPLAAAGYRVIAPDLPGFGDAPAVAGGPAPWTEVIELLDALGIEQAVLVGNSFGGAVALRMAVVARERVAGLVLVSAPAVEFDPSPQLAAAWDAEEAALAAGDIDRAVDSVVDAWMLAGGPPFVRDRVAAMQRRAFELQASASDDAPEPPDPLEADPGLLAQVDAPALVAVGEHDMRDFIDGAGELAKRLPQAGSPTVIERAGHLAPLEQPTAFLALLREFLEGETRAPTESSRTP
jgi:pimeloyl-ACP methyl ester carboxylesterase